MAGRARPRCYIGGKINVCTRPPRGPRRRRKQRRQARMVAVRCRQVIFVAALTTAPTIKTICLNKLSCFEFSTAEVFVYRS
jgi:hypothetical protein